MIDIGIDYYDELKPMWEKDGDESQKIEAIWKKMKPILLAQLVKLR